MKRLLLSVTRLALLVTSFALLADKAQADSINIDCLEMAKKQESIKVDEELIKEVKINFQACNVALHDEGVTLSATGEFYVYAVKKLPIGTTTGKLQGILRSNVSLDPKCNITNITFETSSKKFEGSLGWLIKQWFYELRGHETIEDEYKQLIEKEFEELKQSNEQIRNFCEL